MESSSEIVRSVTDEQVLRALIRNHRLTRAELAASVDISKPTAGESVRRLTERGLVVDTGERTQGGRGKGRVGSYYALAPGVGTALAISIAPEGVVAECVDVYGNTVGRAAAPINRPATPEQVGHALHTVAAALHTKTGGVPRLAVVSAADPVDRATGRLVQLPDAPFLVGELDPVSILGVHVPGPIIVDNDVNWAALAERNNVDGADFDTELTDFVYLFLGEGLGCALVSDGEIKRGSSGLAGEIAHLITAGPGGEAVRFIEVFDALELRRPGSTAIDVDRLLESGLDVHESVVRAVCGVLAAIVALTDPEVVVLGGPWGRHPAMIEAVRSAFAQAPRSVPIRPAEHGVLTGVRGAAVERVRAAVINSRVTR